MHTSVYCACIVLAKSVHCMLLIFNCFLLYACMNNHVNYIIVSDSPSISEHQSPSQVVLPESHHVTVHSTPAGMYVHT